VITKYFKIFIKSVELFVANEKIFRCGIKYVGVLALQ
jgi:hypothetical protein